MSKMRVTISPSDKESRAAKGLISTLILLSKERGVNCQLASPTEATIEGDEGTLLEILDQIDSSRSIREKMGVAIATEFEKSRNKLSPFLFLFIPSLNNTPIFFFFPKSKVQTQKW